MSIRNSVLKYCTSHYKCQIRVSQSWLQQGLRFLLNKAKIVIETIIWNCSMCCSKDEYFHYLIEAEWRIYASVNYTIFGSDNGLSPGRRQAITWPNAGILLIGPLGTNFSEIFIEIKTFSLTNLYLKVSSAKVAAILSRPRCVKPKTNHDWYMYLGRYICSCSWPYFTCLGYIFLRLCHMVGVRQIKSRVTMPIMPIRKPVTLH